MSTADLFNVVLPRHPYPGLRPFEPDEWPIFFGRERMADEVIERIVRQQLVVVHGDSGCGKSSLLRAGVLPRLAQEQGRGGLTWRTCTTLPREAPLRRLAQSIARLGSSSDEGLEARTTELRRVLNFGHNAPRELARLVRQNDDDQVLIVVDQFEELFTFAALHGRDEARLYTEFLLGFLERPPSGLHVVLTMRSEFLGACAQYPGFAQAVNGAQYLLPPMSRNDLLRAITEPAPLYGGKVMLDLAERLMVDAGTGQDQLPLIQHALLLLYQRRRHGLAEGGSGHAPSADSGQDTSPGEAWVLDAADYRNVGDVTSMLSKHADDVMKTVERDAPGVTELLFRALTHINADGAAVRRPQNLSELVVTTGTDDATLTVALNAFRSEGVSFLRPYAPAQLRADTLIDISHEALIRCWTRIADPNNGWLAREFQDGLIWRSLLVQVDSFDRDASNLLSPATAEERSIWLVGHRAGWAARYGGEWPRVESLVDVSMTAAQVASRARHEQVRISRRNVRIVAGLLAVAVSMSAFAFWALYRARTVNMALTGQFALSAFREAVERNSRGDSAGAMAFAARALRLSAGEPGARALSVDLLVNRVWPTTTLVHGGSVWAVAWSPDGTRVLTGSADKTARVWDARTGQAVGAPLAHQASVVAVAWSPDGTRVLTGSDDKTARVWDARTGQAVGAPLAHQASVVAVAWSPDGTRVLTGSADRTARVWDARTGRGVGAALAHQGLVVAVAWSPDGTRVLTASWDNTARVWDARTGQAIGDPLAHRDRVWVVAWSPDGTRVLTGSADRTARVWDARTGQAVGDLLQHQGPVWAVAWSFDGTRVLTGSADKTARVWDARTGRVLGAPLAHRASVGAVAWSPDGTRVLTGSADKTARVWDARTGEVLGAPLAHQASVGAVAWSSDGTRVLTGSDDNTARVWEARTGQAVGELLPHQASVLGVAWSPDGTHVLTGSADNTARVWDARTGQPVGATLAHQGPVWAVAWSPDGTRALTGSEDKTARMWDARTGQPVGAPLVHQATVGAVAWSPDGTRVLTGSLDKTARVWDARTGQAVGAPLAHQDPVGAVAWSPDGTRVLTGSADSTARVWDARTGQPVGAPLAHQDPVGAVAWSPDGTRVVTGSADRTARVWDARTGQPVGAPLAHQEPVMAVAWSPDGTRVLTGSLDKTVRVWDARTGQAVGAPLAHQDRVWAVAWSPDSTRVLTGSDDKTARVWDAPLVDAADADRMARVAELLSGLRVNEQSSLEPLEDSSRLGQLAVLKEDVASERPKRGSLGDLLKWVFAPVQERTISPLSRMSADEYVRRMLAVGAEGRVEVERTFPGHPLLRQGNGYAKSVP